MDKRKAVRAVVSFIFFVEVLLLGCDNSSEPGKTEGNLSMTSVYSTLSAPPPALKEAGAVLGDTVTISRARFVIRDIQFKSATDDSATFKSEPFVLDLDLAGLSQTIAVVPMKFGTFQRIEFDVHRIEQNEVQAMGTDQQTQFQNFLEGERYSIIIEGTYTPSAGTPQAFMYRSKVDAKQKVDLSPELVISETLSDANVSMVISSFDWFRNTAGTLVDPRDTNNEGVIDENLKNSIRVFKDNNKDGSKD